MEKKVSDKKKKLLAASVAGLMAIAGAVANAGVLYAQDYVQCAGVNACKGTGDCGGKGYSCAGKNACKGQGWLKFPSAELCQKVGGTVLPSAGEAMKM